MTQFSQSYHPQKTTPTTVPTLAEIERDAIQTALKICHGNVTRAAALLDIAPSTLYRKRQGWIISE